MRQWGTSVITICTGSRDPNSMWRAHPDNNTPEAWHDLVESMKQALEVAEEYEVTLALEPEVANVVDSAPKARRLLDEMQSPYLKVCMDGANIFHKGELPKMGEILDEAFALLKDDIALAHAKDLDRDGEAGHLAAGTGPAGLRSVSQAAKGRAVMMERSCYTGCRKSRCLFVQVSYGKKIAAL